VNRILLFLFLGLSLQQGIAQEKQQIAYSSAEIEQLFLDRNLSLLAEKYKIKQAEAVKLQASYWNNPTVTLEELNPFSNKTAETLPTLFGNYGKHQQIAFNIEQVIETAGKRKKRVFLEQLNKEQAELSFLEQLRNLKFDLRSTVIELQKLQREEVLLSEQYERFQHLSSAFERQWKEGNISEMDYVRIHTESLNFKQELLAVQREKLSLNADLKTLLHLSDAGELIIKDSLSVDHYIPSSKFPEYLSEALQNRADFKIVEQDVKIAGQQVKIEQAEAKPNITLGINYDRGGNIMQDFVGLSISSDIPLFNRNKGNIKAAQIESEIKHLEKEQLAVQIQNEVSATLQKLQVQEQNLKAWDLPFQKQLDKSMQNYVNNLSAKNISLLAFLDFMQAFIQQKRNLLELQEDYLKTSEELKYTIGKDL